MPNKTCRDCGATKPLSHFREYSPVSFSKNCRVCINLRRNELQRAHRKERRQEYTADKAIDQFLYGGGA